MAYAAKVNEPDIAAQFDPRGMLGGTTEVAQFATRSNAGNAAAGNLEPPEVKTAELGTQRSRTADVDGELEAAPKDFTPRELAPREQAPKIAYQGPKFPTNGMG
jgi:hypothetical protein